MAEIKKKTEYFYLDVLRILASLMVVCVHVSAAGIHEKPFASYHFAFSCAYDILGLVGVPLFMMITGALMLREEYDASPKKIVRKSLKCLGLFLLWMAFYQTTNYFTKGGELSSIQNFYFYEGGTKYQLWYLPALAVLYLLIPFLRAAVTQDRKVCLFYIGAVAVVLTVYTLLSIGRAFPLTEKVAWSLGTVVDKIKPDALVGYIGYILMGYYLSTMPAQEKTVQKRFLLLGGAVALEGIGICSAILASVRTDSLQIELNSPMNITSMLAAAAVFLVARFWLSGKYCKWVSDFSGLTLGIYLIHPFVIDVLGRWGITSGIGAAAWSIPCVTLLVFAVSAGISFVISQLPVLRYAMK